VPLNAACKIQFHHDGAHVAGAERCGAGDLVEIDRVGPKG